MGAGHVVALAQQAPDRYAAVAALAGAGFLQKPDAFRNLPIFIGCGKEDSISLAGTRKLKEALEKAGAKQVLAKEYEDIEHMAVVQVAIPEVFKFFEKAME